ncbi:hypothetical protein M438DRAFT_277398 [Aureobasidium pullulans EXF-150]|uniref:Uncharacterized protein n=1 Tax=Aureobasidium pullulans EXF-150 TaxID=1043002 RepID=A0A074XKD3_AURPU|nr:uncharacterized protein M438DRAFT_277398 [Aureobasidium pullulans EXF-150]KEQ82492.1 hypothetical protein M438DRAFT_277398 [Aureobasidium pullulans EXF-150]
MSNSYINPYNSSAACPITDNLYPRVPESWNQRNSTNFTQAACAVPACSNYTSTLATCCGRTDSELQYFNTTIGPYASCALSDGNDPEAYQAFQRCMLLEYVTPFQCNNQDSWTTDGTCLGIQEVPTTLANVTSKQQSCSMITSPNATRAMAQCCNNYNGGEGLFAFSQGSCNTGCVSNSTDNEFYDCLFDFIQKSQFPAIESGVVCTENNKDDREGAGVQTSPSISGILTMLLVGSSILLL